jgi:hypothetical protein
MVFSGDNTSDSASESVTIKFFRALFDGQWNDSVTVDLYAGWYSPAGGSGPVNIVVTSCGGQTQSKTVSPGSQTGCASTQVGSVTINKDGTFVLN